MGALGPLIAPNWFPMTTHRSSRAAAKSNSRLGLCSMAVLSVALPLLPSCQSGSSRFDRRLDEIGQLTRDRSYVEAAQLSVDLVEDTAEDSPRYGEALEAQRTVSLASQLDLARTLSLDDSDDEALQLLAQLKEQYPNASQVAAWHERTRRKLASKWFGVAREALASETFEAARAAYARVLEYDPDHPVAGLSLEDLERLEAYRAELADDYYNGGVRGSVEGRLSEARWNFGNNLKYDVENPKSLRRIGEVDRARAVARAESARSLVEQELYSAAAKEYSIAADLAPESEEIQRNLAALKSEAKAQTMLSQAEFLVLRGEIDKAEELLAEGVKLTALQTEAFADAVTGIDDARIEKQYQSALDKEHDFRFPAAIEAYKELLSTRDFYKDTRARIDALEGYVASAEQLYDAAAAETDSAKRLELLQQIDVFWPEYKNVAEQIRALKK